MFSTIGKHRWIAFSAFIMLVSSNALQIINPLILRGALLTLESDNVEELSFFDLFFSSYLPYSQESIYPWMITLIAIAGVASLFTYGMRVSFVRVSREGEVSIRSALFDRLQSQSQQFYDRYEIGDIMSRMTNDISLFREVLGPGVMYPLHFLTKIIPAFIALYLISPWMTLLSLLPLLLLPLLMLFVRSHMYKASKNVQEALSKMSSMTHEHYTGILLVKYFVKEVAALVLFQKLCKKFFSLSMRQAVIQVGFFPFLTFFSRVVTLLLLFLAGAIVSYSWTTLRPADFVSFMWIQSQVFVPVLMLGWVLPMYERGRAAYDRLYSLYSEPIEIQKKEKKETNFSLHKEIKFKNLSFTYPTAKIPALSNINLSLKQGEWLGITGPPGGGKTTLLQLINRSYELQKGTLTIGDLPIQEIPEEEVHRNIAYVEQQPFLFSKTIYENIVMSPKRKNNELLEKVLEWSDLKKTFEEFPKGLETRVGERGVTLSGGQKQRVAIARALYQTYSRQSILLFDDIFSSLDAATEDHIFQALKKEYRERTLILVTHRVTLLRQLDNIIFMGNGEILEEGNHKKLVEKKGQYAALVGLQKLTEEFINGNEGKV